jgi:D-glycero-alpha-D-manno-heptose-7-phosphate kinase
MNSGLGGSAVILSAIIGCFNEFRIDKWNKYEIAEMAYQSERLMYNISGGWQDQYATVFGGINLIEFKKDKNIINSLRIDDEIILELKENLILCDTRISHNSSGIHDDQKKELENKDGITDLVRQNVDLTYSIRDSLVKGDLSKFGEQLNQGWRNKKQFSKKISNQKLDEIYNIAIDNGALGGKLLGAGGGGFFLFYCDPMKRWNVVKSLIKIKAKVVEFNFETKGLISWKIRKK